MPGRRVRILPVIAVVAVLGGSSTARAQTVPTSTTAPDTVGRALAMARAAFEYRDFGQVVRALDPWVHPPRIRSPDAMIAARRLLGVSLHVLGNLREAREEFAQLLLLDPGHQLDPFVIPPQVIATFEEVRTQLGPTLGPGSPGIETRRGPEPRLHPSVLWMPLGIPQLVQGQTELGLTFGTLQVAGLTVNVIAFLQGDSLDAPRAGRPGDPDREVWLGVQYGALGLLALAYAGSVIHGYVLHGQKNEADARERPPPIAAGPGGLGLRF